ncbi:sensor histidine kinase, partial [Vallitalea guaymasensis]
KQLLNKAELKALQAQIQPHFLFNTLNTIVYFCRTDPEKARELLLKLSYYLRNNFKTTGDFISLKEEILYVESYLTIEQARFPERLKVEYDIEEGIQCKIPPLLIQPIVENAVKHGLMAKKAGGKIVISIKQREEYVVITVSDNGVGMTEEQLERLFDNNKKQGIGVNNVNNRLKSIYNTSLKIKSKEGEGTTMIMEIPIRGKKHD